VKVKRLFGRFVDSARAVPGAKQRKARLASARTTIPRLFIGGPSATASQATQEARAYATCDRLATPAGHEARRMRLSAREPPARTETPRVDAPSSLRSVSSRRSNGVRAASCIGTGA